MASSVAEANKAVVRALVEEVINGGRVELLEELVAEDFVDRAGDEPAVGREPYRLQLQATRAAFPDLEMTIEDEIAEDDRVVVRLRWRGTHKGTFLGVAPTGKTIEMTGIGILRVRGGQVVERWNESDVLGLLDQLGMAPAPV